MSQKNISAVLCFFCSIVFANANAGFISSVSCGGSERMASSTSAVACKVGLGNPKASTILNDFPSTPWTKAGELVSNGSNGLFAVGLTSGSWGESPIEANWEISSSFWDNYIEAVISMHVGNGGGDPDYFAWSITDNATSGSISYEVLSGSGGGLSNIKLWGRTENVPAPATLVLFGLGLFGMMFNQRKKKISKYHVSIDKALRRFVLN